MFIAWSALFHLRPAPAKFQGRKTRNLVDANWKTNNILREALRTDSNLAKVSLQRGKSSGKSRLKMCGSILFCSPLLITIGSARRQAAHASCLFLRFCVSLSSDLSLDGPQLPLHIFTSSVNSAENGIYASTTYLSTAKCLRNTASYR